MGVRVLPLHLVQVTRVPAPVAVQTHLVVLLLVPAAVPAPAPLVVPVQFVPTTINKSSGRGQTAKKYGSFSSTDLAKLNKIFNGTSAETGYESVSSFYKKSSYGKLNLTFDIADVFTTSNNFTYYQNSTDSEGYNDGDSKVLKEVLQGLDAKYDFSSYDYNHDGYIDGIYLIYSIPFGGSDSMDDDLYYYTSDTDFWWAWVNWYLTDDYEYYDGVEANYFMWASIDFANEPYDEAYETTIEVNTLTYIHETGHMLGLDDYYDYDFSGQSPKQTDYVGGVGGADLMDYTVGDHSPISKILLGWITPTVVTTSTSNLTLVSLQSNVGNNEHQVLLIPKHWNDSYFDEYLLIDFYTPNELNRLSAGQYGLFSEAGVRIYHIDATVDGTKGKMNDSNYDTMFSYNNSSTAHTFVRLLEADNDKSLESAIRAYDSSSHEYYYTTPSASNTDLFQANNTLNTRYTWYDNTQMGFSIKVASVANTCAIISITYK